MRPSSAHSTAGGRPGSAACTQQLAAAAIEYQVFCAALVHVAAKLARGSAEALETCPYLSVGAGCLRAVSCPVGLSTLGCMHRITVGPIASYLPSSPARVPYTANRTANRTAPRCVNAAVQEQARAFISSVLLPKAQRVMPTAPRIIRKKSTPGGASVAIKPGGGMGPKEAAAKEAAAKLKTKRAQRRPSAAAAAAAGRT